MEIQVREALPADAASIERLEKQLYDLHHQRLPEIFKAVEKARKTASPETGGDGDRILVAVLGAEVVGYLSYAEKTVEESEVLYQRKMYHVIDLVVDDAYRGQGVGTALLFAVEARAKTNGMDSIEVPVFSFNESAAAFYEGRGYAEYVRRFRKNLGGRTWEEAMEKTEELEMIDSVENGEWTSVANLAEMKTRLMRAATETALKDYRINVRISKRDVEALKTKALEEGIPYQTLVTSILHKYVTGSIVESKDSV